MMTARAALGRHGLLSVHWGFVGGARRITIIIFSAVKRRSVLFSMPRLAAECWILGEHRIHVSWKCLACLPRIHGSGSRDVAGGDSRGPFDIIRQLNQDIYSPRDLVHRLLLVHATR